MVDTPLNKEFYEKTRTFVTSALALLDSYLKKGEEIPYNISTRLSLEDGVQRTVAVRQPLYSVFVGEHRDELEHLAEYEACVSFMHLDTVISKHLDSLVGTPYTATRREAWDYLSYFLQYQLAQASDSLEFNAELFEHVYLNLEQFFYTDSVDFQAFSPLYNFKSDVDEIALGDGLRIKKMSMPELEEFLDDTKTCLQMPYFESAYLNYAILRTHQEKKVYVPAEAAKVPFPRVDLRADFGKLVTALRLFKSGAIGLNVIRVTPTVDVPNIGRFSVSGIDYNRFFGQVYSLMGKEVEEFKIFWNWFKEINLEQAAPFSVAIRRFNYAYERNKLEDKLVDYMVAFEALFFKKGEMGEFRHKLAVRVSRLLNGGYGDRKNRMGQMLDFYDKRSKVVHGEEVTFGGDFKIEAVENNLRQSIVLLIQRSKTNHDEILTHLDLD